MKHQPTTNHAFPFLPCCRKPFLLGSLLGLLAGPPGGLADETCMSPYMLKVFLIDSQQRLRNVYSYELLDPRLVLADVKTLLLEQKLPAGD